MKKPYDKNLIKRSFSRAATTYDECSNFQKDVAREVEGLIREILPDVMQKGQISMLDIGCGTGALIEAIERDTPSIKIYGCDLAHSMLTQARDKLGKSAEQLIAADMEQLPYPDSSFDIAASSLSYQWATHTESAFKEVCRVLKPGGFFCMSTLGPNTQRELKTCITEAAGVAASPQFMEFEGIEGLETALKNAGLESIKIENHTHIRKYEDLSCLLKNLKNIGATNPIPSNGEQTHLNKRIITKASGLYNRRFPSPGTSGIRATYDVILIVARKKP